MNTLLTQLFSSTGRRLPVFVLAGLLCVLPVLAQARVSLSNLQGQIGELQNQDEAASGQLVIDSAYVSKITGNLLIQVANLGGGDPEVTLAGQVLPLLSVTPDTPAPGVSTLEVFLPTAGLSTEAGSTTIVPPGSAEAVTVPVFAPGSYILTVVNGGTRSQFDAFELAISARDDGPRAPRTRSFGTGLTVSEDIMDCVINEAGFDCEKKKIITFQVPVGGPIALEIVVTHTIQQNGEPVEVEETMELEAWQVPRPGRFGYDIHFKLIKGSLSLEFKLAPDDPVYAIDEPAISGFKLRAELVKDARVALTLDMGVQEVSEIHTEALGILREAVIQPYAAGATDTRLTVEIENYGDLKTNYLVVVNQCTEDVDMMPAQLRELEPREKTSLAFDLHLDGGLHQGLECKVSLKAPTGRLYDEKIVTAPAPQ